MKFTYASGSRPLDGYTVKRGVGHGGFGEVYYAVSDGGKEVALKLVQRNLDVELRGVAQCMNLKHPNLVTLYDLRTNDAGEHFVVMEYVAGKCLSQVLEEHPHGLPLDDVNRWFLGICAGIGYLHDKGIVHRDLKPGNLFIEDGVVKVGDYGLSKFITTSRRSGQTESVGTVHYMAPEISRGKYDREIDIYSTGIILYEMLTGDVPFDGESVGEILMKHLTAQPDVSNLPPPYDRMVARALEKDPAGRYRSMEEFAASLNGQHTGSAAPPPRLRETANYVSPASTGPVPNPVAGIAQPPAPLAAAAGQGTAQLPSQMPPTRRHKRAFAAGLAVGVAVLAALVLFAFKSAWSVVDLNESRHVAVTEERPAVTPTWFGWLAILVIVSVGAGAISLFAKKLSETRLARAAVVAHPVAAGTAVPAAPLAAPVMLQPAGRLLHPRPSQLDAAPKTARRKVAEATAAMLLSAPLSVIASVLAAGIMGLRTLSESALLAATCLAGCWAVVMAGKWSEGRSGDPVLQRLLMAAMGLAVGFWNGYLDGLLDTGLFARSRGVQGWLEAPVWMPDLLAHASYFGVIFLAPNWWQLADARRSIRFNLGLVIVPCLWAWVVSWFWSAPPQTWGVVTAGLIATVAQLASPWEDRGGRRRPV